jgi:hypothetical protein
MPYVATIVATLLLAVPAISVELSRYLSAAKDGDSLDFVFSGGGLERHQDILLVYQHGNRADKKKEWLANGKTFKAARSASLSWSSREVNLAKGKIFRTPSVFGPWTLSRNAFFFARPAIPDQ